jgi:hypothetical protein
MDSSYFKKRIRIKDKENKEQTIEKIKVFKKEVKLWNKRER